jgi:CTP synthase
MKCGRKLSLIPVDSEHLEDIARQKEPGKYHKAWNAVCEAHGIIVPGKYDIPSTTLLIKLTTSYRWIWIKRH